ncbi:MAG: hypothetical protein WC831_02795 [Parcubacteria group bacterium]|jgi:hypothetical protein
MVGKRFKCTENLVCRVSGLDGKDTAVIKRIRDELSSLIYSIVNVQDFGINFSFPQDLLAEERNPSCEIWWLGFIENQGEKLKAAIKEYFTDNFGDDAVVNIVNTRI